RPHDAVAAALLAATPPRATNLRSATATPRTAKAISGEPLGAELTGSASPALERGPEADLRSPLRAPGHAPCPLRVRPMFVALAKRGARGRVGPLPVLRRPQQRNGLAEHFAIDGGSEGWVRRAGPCPWPKMMALGAH